MVAWADHGSFETFWRISGKLWEAPGESLEKLWEALGSRDKQKAAKCRKGKGTEKIGKEGKGRERKGKEGKRKELTWAAKSDVGSLN